MLVFGTPFLRVEIWVAEMGSVPDAVFKRIRGKLEITLCDGVVAFVVFELYLAEADGAPRVCCCWWPVAASARVHDRFVRVYWWWWWCWLVLAHLVVEWACGHVGVGILPHPRVVGGI